MNSELGHSLITAPGASPRRWLLSLHGIFGSGDNWRGFARRLVEAQPSWGIALVDLRMHGRSMHLPPPHTVLAAANDLAALASSLPGQVQGVLGHSFGGKVALAYLDQHPQHLGPVIIVDSNPGTRKNEHDVESASRVLRLLEENAGPFPSRQAFVERVMSAGVSLGVAQFLAKNVEKRGEQYFFRLDLCAIDSLLESYFTTDLWHALEAPPGDAHVWLIIGGRSTTLDAADRERAQKAAERSPGRLRVETIEKADHWVHVDAPEELFAIVREALG